MEIAPAAVCPAPLPDGDGLPPWGLHAHPTASTQETWLHCWQNLQPHKGSAGVCASSVQRDVFELKSRPYASLLIKLLCWQEVEVYSLTPQVEMKASEPWDCLAQHAALDRPEMIACRLMHDAGVVFTSGNRFRPWSTRLLPGQAKPEAVGQSQRRLSRQAGRQAGPIVEAPCVLLHPLRCIL